MHALIKNTCSYTFYFLVSSFKILVLSIIAFIFLAFMITVIVTVSTNSADADYSSGGMAAILLVLIILYMVIKGIVAIAISFYRSVRPHQTVVPYEYTKVTKVKPVSITPELTDTDKKALFLEFEKEWIVQRAKRFRTLER